MTDLPTIQLVCPGPPTPRRDAHPGRGRHGELVWYPDKVTEQGFARWRRVWRDAGEPFIPGPVELELLIARPRPDSHLLANGVALSASGRQHSIPSKPDCSNVLKLVEDALKEHAFGDDRLVARVTVAKVFAEPEQMTLVVRPWAGALPVQTSILEGP